MSISQLARSIEPSPTLRMNEEATLLRQKGEPVIHLGIGEPKNKAPISALLSSAARLNTGNIKYTPNAGIPSLIKAVIRYTEENYGRMVSAQNVIVSGGAKQSIYNLLLSIIDPQDEVILLAPYWVSYPDMVRLTHGVPVVVTPEDGTFQPSMEEIEQATSSYTKAIIVNSPNNPSGTIYSDEFIAQIVEYCESRKIYLIMDDIYHKLVFDGRKPSPGYSFTHKDVENSYVIVINGVSKLYGMTGFRIGWAIGPSQIIEAMDTIQSTTSSGPSVVTQAAAEGALTGVQSVIDDLRLTIQNNRDVLMRELRSFNSVHTTPPQGTFYALPDFRAYNGNSVELADFLLKKALVVTVPGATFGMEGYLRLSFAGTVGDVTEGIKRMKWALDPNAPNDIYIGDRKLIRDWL
jgi:aspartate aminotransferase